MYFNMQGDSKAGLSKLNAVMIDFYFPDCYNSGKIQKFRVVLFSGGLETERKEIIVAASDSAKRATHIQDDSAVFSIN